MVQVTEQILREAPNIEAEKLYLMQQGKRLAQQDLAPMLPGYQVAGFAPGQQAAIRAAETQGIGGYMPYISAANQAIGQGYGTTAEAADALRAADTRRQFADAQAAMQQAGMATTGITAGIPTLQQGIGATQMGQVAALGATGQYDPRSAAAFMNPYQQQVTQSALQEMRRQGDIARQNLSSQAVRAGAFGGTREGVQRAEMERGLQDVMSQRIFQDYAQNFGQAQQASMGAEEAARQRQLGVASAMGQLGQQYGNLAGQAGALYGQQAGQFQQLGQGIGSLAGQQFGIGQAISSGLGQFGSQLGQLGVQQAALGQTAQALQQGDIGFLYNIGRSQQALNQQLLDAQRATQTQQIYAPYQQLAFLSDIQKGAPSTQMATTAATTPQASPFQQVTGTALGLAAINKAF